MFTARLLITAEKLEAEQAAQLKAEQGQADIWGAHAYGGSENEWVREFKASREAEEEARAKAERERADRAAEELEARKQRRREQLRASELGSELSEPGEEQAPLEKTQTERWLDSVVDPNEPNEP